MPPVNQAGKHGGIILGKLEAFLDRPRRVIQHEAKIPEAGNHGANASFRRRRDSSGAAFGEEKEQVEVGAGGEFSSSVAARRNRGEWATMLR